MKKVLIDTNFILSCVKKKIDFLKQLELEGFEILIPKQVFEELEKIINSKKRLKQKEAAQIGILILEKNKKKSKKIDLKENYVDKGIRKYIRKNPEIFVATLDKELKKKFKEKTIIIRGKKLEIV